MRDKNFLYISEQIKHLENNKNVIIDINKKDLATFLLENNYFNFINSVKILLAKERNGKKHIYEETNISEWIEKYIDMRHNENIFFKEILNIELKINSYLSYNIALLYKKEQLTDRQKYFYISEVKKSKYYEKALKDKNETYILENSWRIIPFLTLGSVIRIFKSLDTQTINNLCASNGIKECELQDLVVIRNGLAHNTPITVLLTDKYNSKKRIKLLKKLNFDSGILGMVELYNEMCN